MRWVLFGLLIVSGCTSISCTSKATKVAIEQSIEYEKTQDTIFTRLHERVSQYQYNDLAHSISQIANRALTKEELAYLNKLWNERAFIEFLTAQHERNRARHLIAVDSALYNSQSIFDVIYKSLVERLQEPKNVGNDPK